MGKRVYNQYCAIARSLDVVGERWTLLLIRELLTGPKRFTDLLEHLAGIGTNLLSSRLKELEESGLIAQEKLPAPASSVVYTLTDRGAGLEPVLEALAQWGRPLLGPPREKDQLAPGWLMLAMKKSFRPEAAEGVDEVYEYRVDADVFQVRVFKNEIRIEQGRRWGPQMVLTTDSDTLMRVVAGEIAVDQALSDGGMHVDGDMEAFYRTFMLFGVAVNS